MSDINVQVTSTGFVVTKSLDAARRDKLAELETAFQASFTTFTSNATGVTKTYPFDTIAQGKLKDLQGRAILDTNKNSFSFYTFEDQAMVSHTRAQFLQLLDDAEARELNLFSQKQVYEKNINTTTDVPTIDAMTFTFT